MATAKRIPARRPRASVVLRSKIALFGRGTSAAAHRFWTHPQFPAAYREYIFRSHSIIRASVPLMQAAEEWARTHGCRELASDTWIDSEISQRAHAALGFEVVDRCVHFRKPL